MQKVYELHGQGWPSDTACESSGESYGNLVDVEDEVRTLIKGDFKDLKEGQVKDLLALKVWIAQKVLLDKAVRLQAAIGTGQCDDFNEFEGTLRKVLKETVIKL